MPLYEYYCKDCRGKFELLTTYTDSEVDVECSKCHSTRVRKMFSVFAAPHRGLSDDFGSDYSDDDGEYGSGGGCACGGGACGCND